MTRWYQRPKARSRRNRSFARSIEKLEDRQMLATLHFSDDTRVADKSSLSSPLNIGAIVGQSNIVAKGYVGARISNTAAGTDPSDACEFELQDASDVRFVLVSITVPSCAYDYVISNDVTLHHNADRLSRVIIAARSYSGSSRIVLSSAFQAGLNFIEPDPKLNAIAVDIHDLQIAALA